MVTLQCPVCKRTQRVIATSRPITATCSHGGTRKVAVMVRITDTNQQESA